MTTSQITPLPQCPDRSLIELYQTVDCKIVKAAEGKVDAIQMAAELGRLDVVSIFIALLSIMIAIIAVFGFLNYRNVVEQRAREDVRELLPRTVKLYLENHPELILEAIKENSQIVKMQTEDDTIKYVSEIAEEMENEEGDDVEDQ